MFHRFPVSSLVLLASGACLLPRQSAGADDTGAPPPQEITFDVSATGASTLTNGADAVVGRQSVSYAAVSFLEQQPLDGGTFYFGWGAGDEIYSFGNSRTFSINRLQDVEGNFSLEYFVKSEEAASLTVSPGVYFQNHPGNSSWDAPILFTTGVPMAETVSGELGVMDGRLYHRPIPIFGVIWTVSPAIRVEAAYPEPSLAVTCSKDLDLNLSGELVGGAFETDPSPNRTRVEYSGYRVGASFDYKLGKGFRLSGGAGEEIEREFDFFQESQRVDAARAPYVELSLDCRF